MIIILWVVWCARIKSVLLSSPHLSGVEYCCTIHLILMCFINYLPLEAVIVIRFWFETGYNEMLRCKFETVKNLNITFFFLFRVIIESYILLLVFNIKKKYIVIIKLINDKIKLINWKHHAMCVIYFYYINYIWIYLSFYSSIIALNKIYFCLRPQYGTTVQTKAIYIYIYIVFDFFFLNFHNIF